MWFIPGVALLAWLAAYAGRNRLRGTTLVDPWWWGCAALAALAGASLLPGKSGSSPFAIGQELRFVAACMTYCHAMSLMGAKRPQNRAWHFVVFTLWFILVQPALEILVFYPHRELAIHPLRGAFCILLTLTSVLSFVPTRAWKSGALLAVGQLLLVGSYLWSGTPFSFLRWFGVRQTAEDQYAWGTLLWGIGFALWAWGNQPRRKGSVWERAWCDFRDDYGLMWALWIADKFNTLAIRRDWPVRIGLQHKMHAEQRQKGLASEAAHENVPAEIEAEMRQTLSGLLAKFVSEEWLAQRMEDSPPPREQRQAR